MTETYVLILIGILVIALVLAEWLADSGVERRGCSKARLYLNKGVAEWCCGYCQE